MEKLQELAGPGSLASAPVRKAAARALTDVTKGRLPLMALFQTALQVSTMLEPWRLQVEHAGSTLHVLPICNTSCMVTDPLGP